jgi:hypothetical protein
VVDFQFFSKGMPLLDLSVFLFSSISVQMYQQEIEHFLEFYQKQINGKLNIKGEMIHFSLNDAKYELIITNIFGCLITLASFEVFGDILDRVCNSIEVSFNNESFDMFTSLLYQNKHMTKNEYSQTSSLDVESNQ